MLRSNRLLNGFSFGLAIASVLITLAARAQSPDDEDVVKGFTGRWNIDSGVNQGTPIPEDRLKGTYAIITSDVITTFDSKEKEAYKATYTIDTSKSPMQIDMVASRGGQQVKALGIIRLDSVDSNSQKACMLAYSLDPSERPSSFESPLVAR